MIQNGVGFYLTWISIATSINFVTFLTYDGGIEVSLSSTIGLILVATLVLIYFIFENFIWPRYLLFMFTPWFVLILSLFAIVQNNFSKGLNRNNLITIGILIGSIFFFLIKIIMFILFKTSCKYQLNRKIRGKFELPKIERNTAENNS